MSEELKTLRDMCDFNSKEWELCKTEYNQGFANGLIFALSIMENKEPKYLGALPCDKAKPTFTKEDVEKAEFHVYSELLGWFGNDIDFDEDMAGDLAKAALNAVGRVEE